VGRERNEQGVDPNMHVQGGGSANILYDNMKTQERREFVFEEAQSVGDKVIFPHVRRNGDDLHPSSLIEPHRIQLFLKDYSGQASEYSGDNSRENANLLKRGSANLVVILLSALGFKCVSDGIDAGRYGGNRGLVKIAPAVRVMIIAVPIFFFVVLGLTPPYPY
jgi:hypothetical protein